MRVREFKDKISKMKNRQKEFLERERHKKILRDLWNNIKKSNIHVPRQYMDSRWIADRGAENNV